jgi:hypothetical protein
LNQRLLIFNLGLPQTPLATCLASDRSRVVGFGPEARCGGVPRKSYSKLSIGYSPTKPHALDRRLSCHGPRGKVSRRDNSFERLETSPRLVVNIHLRRCGYLTGQRKRAQGGPCGKQKHLGVVSQTRLELTRGLIEGDLLSLTASTICFLTMARNPALPACHCSGQLPTWIHSQKLCECSG